MLHLGVEQEQTAEELLADVDAAYHKAEEAVKLGNKTLQEAQKTYDILQGMIKLFIKFSFSAANSSPRIYTFK